MFNKNQSRTFIATVFMLVWTIALGYIAPGIVSAHADVESSNPAEFSRVTKSPDKVTATFSEELEPAFSKMTVVDQNGNDVTAGKSRAIEQNKGLEVPLKPNLPAGPFTVKWETLAVDGHKESGNFVFTVTGDAKGTGQQSSQSDLNVPKTPDKSSEPATANSSETPSKSSGLTWWYVLIIVVIIAILFIVAKKRARRG